jgi:hypothetical protein
VGLVSAPAPSRSAPTPSEAPDDDLPIIEGPRWYRGRIRSYGPVIGLVIPGIVGAVALGALRLFETASSGAIGLIGGVFAAPGLLVVGAPFGDRSLYPWAVLGSAALWLLVGFVASRRATRNPLATWRDYWRHYAMMLGGIWLGAGVALAIAGLAVGEPLY